MSAATLNKVLVPIDFSDQSAVVLDYTIKYLVPMGAEVVLLYVIEESSSLMKLFSHKVDDVLATAIKEKLEQLAKEKSEKGRVNIRTYVLKGKVYDRILDMAKIISPDVIVMGTNGRIEGNNQFIGSNTLKVVKSAMCPVVTIKGRNIVDKIERIVMPIDFTKETTDKVNRAIGIARFYNAEINMVSVIQGNDKAFEKKLKKRIGLVKERIEEKGVKCTADVVDISKTDETIASAILDYRKKVEGDLIMIMTQQEKGVTNLFLGSQAQQIIKGATVPVLSIVPSEQQRLAEM